MECPVCGLLNPPDTNVCDCGYDFAKRSGGERTPFRERIPKVFILAGMLAGFVLAWMTAADDLNSDGRLDVIDIEDEIAAVLRLACIV